MADKRDISLQSKIAYLRRPGAYPDASEAVDVIETHFAWVFLSRRFVHKLKKPIRLDGVDFRRLQSRRANCELEVALNRRLAEAVYIGVVPLTIAGGALELDGDGTPIEWLVKMHRLPAERMLDRAARNNSVTAAALRAVVGKMVEFYRRTPRSHWTADEYRRKLDTQLSDYAERLGAPALGLDAAAVSSLIEAQRNFLGRHPGLFDRRIDDGRVVDAHGDLRPEHIFLDANPQIIDCLEFSSELRLLDSAAEFAFLGLECERMGEPALAERIMTLYTELGKDPIGPDLLGFYRSLRAVVRALLSAWHLCDPETRDRALWTARANWYLDTARTSIAVSSA